MGSSQVLYAPSAHQRLWKQRHPQRLTGEAFRLGSDQTLALCACKNRASPISSIRTSVRLNIKPAGKSRFASLVSFRYSTQLPNAEPVVADIGLIWEKRKTAK